MSFRLQPAPPRARRQGQPHRQTSRRDDQRGGGTTFSTRHQARCHDGCRAPHATSGHSATARGARAPHGHGHRTLHGGQTSTPSHSEAGSSQSTRSSSARRPSNAQATAPRSKPHRHIPTGGLRTRPAPSHLGSEDSPRSLQRKGRENFSDGHGAPLASPACEARRGTRRGRKGRELVPLWVSRFGPLRPRRNPRHGPHRRAAEGAADNPRRSSWANGSRRRSSARRSSTR